jgi:hypothetical protein
LNPQLKSLGIYGMGPLLPEVIASIARNCRSLVDLDLSQNADFTDALLFELAKSSLNLISLNLDEAALEDDESIHSVLDSFPNLHYLSFAETNISTEMERLSLKKVVIPSIMNADPDIQLMGLNCISANTKVSHLSRFSLGRIDESRRI